MTTRYPAPRPRSHQSLSWCSTPLRRGVRGRGVRRFFESLDPAFFGCSSAHPGPLSYRRVPCGLGFGRGVVGTYQNGGLAFERIWLVVPSPQLVQPNSMQRRSKARSYLLPSLLMSASLKAPHRNVLGSNFRRHPSKPMIPNHHSRTVNHHGQINEAGPNILPTRAHLRPPPQLPKAAYEIPTDDSKTPS